MEASSSSTSATMVSSDPVSSLRAAALSTLKKSKRRKAAAVEKPIPVSLRPPPPSDSFQLDYGQEDNNVKTDPGRLVSEVSQVKEKSPTPIIDTQMREEGEISDEEGPPNIPMQIDDYGFQKSTKSPIPLKSVTPETYMNTTLHIRPTPPPLSPSPRSLSPEAQPTRAQLPAQLPETFVPVFKKEEEVVKIPMLGVSEPDDTVDIGPDRVRPGIDLNQEDYDTVKGIILDLLGWGVPFEFLVDCGVSKEVIFYVFNELELRLPDDFDSSGLIPYTPETIAQIQQQPASMPPPPPPPEKETDLLEPRASPITEAPQTVSTPPAGPLESLSPVLESPQNTDLHDMEKQRRQVLLARKAAVQASRKQKQHVPAKTSVEISAEANDPMVTDSDNNDVAPYAVTETVEDFLNSLSAVKAPEPEPSAVLSVNPEAQSTSMNVEQQEQSITDQAIGLERDQVANGLNSAMSEHFSISSSFADPPPTSVGSSTSNFSYFSSSTPPTPVDVFPRRGSKRPVAADFVDFDPAPKRQEHMSHIERINGTGSITRRLTKGTTFQNINSRRCVIELSDSDSEEDEEAEDPLRRSQPQESSMQWRDKRTQPPPRKYSSPAPIKSVTSGTMSPSLEEKELEIRRLREWIAQREEETRLRKLALARSASATNLNNGGISTSVAQATPLKLEEVDIVISAESAPHVPGKEIQNIKPATPLPAAESPVGMSSR
ncbi:hypothetical protein JR316_0007255 [Psilocybe cubensis]|uniref:Uncharacterized protein n=1 Tax=Psilocybe cubensis TaxID=181762 RepID=A0ACB8GY28_PSICU|nr:hypothetical protein JR316_0007255 [Psilocybe cubensis]KAH9480655.1 hypothetical protein JR316_0007255 [Psilocybe cubensis]